MDLELCLAELLARHGNDSAARDDARRYLRATHDYTAPDDQIPVLEYAERLDFARRIRTTMRDSENDIELNMATFSAIMLAPIHCLRSFSSLLRVQSPHLGGLISGTFDNIHPLLRSFFRGPQAAAPRSAGSSRLSLRRRAHNRSGGTTSPAPASPAPSTRSSLSARNSTERQKALDRDENRCIVTGAAYPQVCHIIPFSWTGSPGNRVTIRHLFTPLGGFLWSPDTLPPNVRDSLWGAHGGADKGWNMLCLSPLLHTWWGKALFGFKLLGRLPVENQGTPQATVPIQLQFRWMPRRTPPAFHPSAAIALDAQENYDDCFITGFQAFDQDSSTIARFNESGQLVRSGHVFTVRLPEADAAKFEAVVNIQWALVQLGAMCAFAEAEDDDDDDDYDDDQALSESIYIDDWAERISVDEDLFP